MAFSLLGSTLKQNRSWQKQIACSLLLIAFVYSAGATSITLPVRINCGGDDFISQNGTSYEADHPYDTLSGYGYQGGDNFATYRYLKPGGTLTPELYLTERVGSFCYDFDLPPGQYVVTLRLSPMLYHGEQLGCFDITANSTPLADDVDLISRTHRCYTGDIRKLVTTQASPLSICFSPSIGQAELAAIEIISADSSQVQAAIGQLKGAPNYGGNFLYWPCDNSRFTSYFEVARATQSESSFEVLPRPDHLSPSYWDPLPTHDQYFSYRVTPVDVWGRRGAPRITEPIKAFELEGSALPNFGLEIEPEQLKIMLAEVYAEHWKPATLILPDGRRLEVETRIRGGVSRHFQKKSFKIKLPDNDPFLNHSILNLVWKVEPTYIRESLAADVFDKQGVAVPKISFVHFILNDETQGVYLTIEQIKDDFLSARGMDPEGSLYKVEGGNMYLPDSEAQYRSLYEKKTGDEDDISEIIHFVETVNLTPDELLPETLWNLIDIEEYLDWYSAIILIANRDVMRGNHYFYLPPDTGRWQIIPWDNDLSFPRYFSRTLPLDMGAEGSYPPVSGGTNQLITRVLSVDQFRFLAGAKLSQLLHDQFESGTSYTSADSLFEIVRFDGLCDRHKLTWEDNNTFLDEFDAVHTFIRKRISYIHEEIDPFRIPKGDLLINEIGLDSDGRLIWAEIYNNSTSVLQTEDIAVSRLPLPGTGYRLSPGEIQPGGYWLIGCDPPNIQPKVMAAGSPLNELEEVTRIISLWKTGSEADSLIDIVTWPAYAAGPALIQAERAVWVTTSTPTPGRENNQTNPGEVEDLLPVIYARSVDGSVSITCDLRTAGSASLSLYDEQGRLVQILKDGWWENHPYYLTWDGLRDNAQRANSGVYFLKLSGAARATEKLLLIR